MATDCHKILESINTSVEAAPKAQVDEVLVVSAAADEQQGGGALGWRVGDASWRARVCLPFSCLPCPLRALSC